MRAFTIWQPWASLVVIGAKPNEFRKRPYHEYIDPPAPGERIAIHAGKRRVRLVEVLRLLEQIEGDDDHTGLIADVALPLLKRLIDASKRVQVLELGAVLGTAVIGEPVLACDLYGLEVADSERGNFNWAWPLRDVLRLDRPVPMLGHQGFWRVPDATLMRGSFAA
jgi:hypothetical protein